MTGTGRLPPPKLNGDVILSIMCEQKPNQKEKISFQADRFRKYIPASYSPKQTEEFVLKALEFYHRHLQRQKQQAR